MKIVCKEIDCATSTTKEGNIRPIKFRYINEEEFNEVINVDKIMEKEFQTFTGIKTWLFKCQSLINGVNRIYELKFEVDKCKWYLYRI